MEAIRRLGDLTSTSPAFCRRVRMTHRIASDLWPSYLVSTITAGVTPGHPRLPGSREIAGAPRLARS